MRWWCSWSDEWGVGLCAVDVLIGANPFTVGCLVPWPGKSVTAHHGRRPRPTVQPCADAVAVRQ
uniref:Uncharacterized protein n=1 Tax=Zea mays TaxID=4577 RepID=B6T2I3_MAIZE|nr:hypothetical protein [Zea mays]